MEAISGTPPYMAPELFDGARNSLQTDIYALGITFFEWLMRCHPYITANGKVDLSLSKETAKRIKQTYGSGIGPLANLIEKSIEVDPRIRPASYDLLLREAAFKINDTENRSSPSQASVSEIIASARVLREQGSIREAQDLLKNNLLLRPNNPLLLNSYGTFLLTQKNRNEAFTYFTKAVEVLKANNGAYNGQPYIDPYLNLSNLLRDGKKYEAAAALIRECQKYLKGIFELQALEYWEFGWVELFDEKFDRAIENFIIYLSRKKASDPALALFCLASFLSCNVSKNSQRCFDLISENVHRNLIDCQYICLIGSYLDPIRLHRLQSRILTPEIIASLRKMSVSICGNPDLFKIPMAEEDIRGILRGIDAEYTGGKYNGVI
jgi:tetratricopeptide (TPR) repeat protein